MGHEQDVDGLLRFCCPSSARSPRSRILTGSETQHDSRHNGWTLSAETSTIGSHSGGRRMGGIRYRKDIDCLTDDELHDLREALAAMYLLPASNPSSFAVQASFHGGPPTEYCRHGAPGLL